MRHARSRLIVHSLLLVGGCSAPSPEPVDAGPQPGALGSPCAVAGECGTGFCVDSVCCNAACTGLCEVCSATGSCSAVAAGLDPANECAEDGGVCRPGTCDGQRACTVAIDGTSCRAAVGACDVAEACLGGSCPSDVVAAVGADCRAEVGPCDLGEKCDGTSTACPADAVRPALTLCRSSQGDCDPVEFCDGVAGACPTDSYLDAGTVCRGSVDLCDVEETCTGTSAGCPLDAFAPSSVVCRGDAGVCDVAELCSGTSAVCPNDAFLTTGCRPAAGVCDLAEVCSGSSAACPNDTLRPSSFACDPAQLYVCSGTTTDCPTSCTSSAQCHANFNSTCRDQKRCHDGKWAFVSSALTTGAIGGLDGGDALCGRLALDAGFGGAFRAWLADDTGSPATRFIRAQVPYYLPNGARLADSYGGLTNNITLRSTFSVDESGTAVPAVNVWSNVHNVGGNAQSTTGHCLNWTSGSVANSGFVGVTNATNNTWTRSSSTQTCERVRRLYCLEQ